MTRRRRFPRPSGGGECYRLAFETILFDDEVTNTLAIFGGGPVLLVHGYPRLTCDGPDNGKKYGHAWLECGRFVVNVGNFPGEEMKLIDRDSYYSIGRIDPAECRRYTREQARLEAIRTEVYGVWSDPPADAIFEPTKDATAASA